MYIPHLDVHLLGLPIDRTPGYPHGVTVLDTPEPLDLDTAPLQVGGSTTERLLTVVETCRRQKRNVLSWMVEAVEARFAGKTAPSLLSGV